MLTMDCQRIISLVPVPDGDVLVDVAIMLIVNSIAVILMVV